MTVWKYQTEFDKALRQAKFQIINLERYRLDAKYRSVVEKALFTTGRIFQDCVLFDPDSKMYSTSIHGIYCYDILPYKFQGIINTFKKNKEQSNCLKCGLNVFSESVKGDTCSCNYCGEIYCFECYKYLGSYCHKYQEWWRCLYGCDRLQLKPELESLI